MAAFPYTSTRILGPINNSTLYFVFQPSTPSQQNSELLALNASGTFDATNLPIAPLSSALPFLSESPTGAYIPTLDVQGNLLAYAGDCRNESDSASTLWKYETGNISPGQNGTWVQLGVNDDGSANKAKLKGANHLASGITFSGTTSAPSELYIFGGMCPNSADLTSTTWTKSAEYSNDMLTFLPQAPTTKSAFLLGLSTSRGPPIAEAGYSITGLQPTSSQSSDGNATQQRNQNFVLLGGHTQSAFINMSQVALFSLPEQGWSFLPVDQPTTSPKTDLAARAGTNVDPRSGHTAVLTSDGQRVIVLGGWVGDVNTAAEPQLAVLELGDGYGGTGDWRWSIPSQSGVGPVYGGGIYGHGAVMLPGNVMMVTGGYTVSGSSTRKSKRVGLLSPNDKSYFFNATSNTWTSTYSRPSMSFDHSKDSGPDTSEVAESRRVGLGAGLTFGILALLALVMVYFWYARRLKRRRDSHERELRNLGVDAHAAHLPTLGQSVNGEEMASRDAYSVTRSHGERSGVRAGSDIDAERTGLLFEIPSPTRGLRRSLHSRGAYQPAPRYDDGRLARGPSNIHPIDERDEYEDPTERGTSVEPGPHPGKDIQTIRTVPTLDPFRDPDGSRTPSPQSATRERQLEVQNWVSDWTAADALMHYRHGRHSPDKTDRTSSTLSDQSAHSAVSAQSWQYSAGTVSRSMSQRSTALPITSPFSPSLDVNGQSQASNAQHAYGMTRQPSSSNRRSQSLTLFANPRRTNTSDTYATATASFSLLQSEGEALLGGYPDQGATSPMRTQSRARGWMGSVRRVFTGADRSISGSPENPSTSSSPIKYHHTEAGVPRRAASAGATLWQTRQGAKDWDVEGTSGRGEGDGGQEAADEEWDVESAVERRVVQVMFTVPKEKLRVVNRGPDGDGVSVVSRESSIKEIEKQQKEKGKGKATEED